MWFVIAVVFREKERCHLEKRIPEWVQEEKKLNVHRKRITNARVII
jgi:hypothetical protein